MSRDLHTYADVTVEGYLGALEEDARELLDRFIESGMAEDEDSDLLNRLHARLAVGDDR